MHSHSGVPRRGSFSSDTDTNNKIPLHRKVCNHINFSRMPNKFSERQKLALPFLRVTENLKVKCPASFSLGSKNDYISAYHLQRTLSIALFL